MRTVQRRGCGTPTLGLSPPGRRKGPYPSASQRRLLDLRQVASRSSGAVAEAGPASIRGGLLSRLPILRAGLRSVQHKQPPAPGVHAPHDQILQQCTGHLGVLARSLTHAEHVLLPLNIHAHCTQHVVIPELDPVQVDHQQVPPVQAPLHQLLEHPLRRQGRLPAHRRPAHPHRFGHRRDHPRVLPRRHPREQDLQHSLRHRSRSVHRLVRRHFHLPARALAPAPQPQPRPLHPHLPVRQVDLTALPSVPHRLSRRARLARLLRPRHPLGAHRQHRLERRPPHYCDHLVDRELRALHQLHHRQQELALSLQELRQPALVSLFRDLVGSLHRGGSV